MPRLPDRTNDLTGYTVIDDQGRTVGPVSGIWVERGSQRPAFASVRTGVLRGRDHVVPLQHARLDDDHRRLHVPYPLERIRDAPSHPVGQLLAPEDARALVAHYRQADPGVRPGDVSAGRLPPDVPLHEERVDVDKRVVRAGAVRLRKVVRTRIVNQPVEVRYEEIVVERIPPEAMPRGLESGALPREPFAEGEMVLPEFAEEPVIRKHAEVVGGVRATLHADARVEDVTTTLRREEVEVSREPPEPGR